MTAILAFTAGLLFMNLIVTMISVSDELRRSDNDGYFTTHIGLVLHMFASFVAVVSVSAALPVLIKRSPPQMDRTAPAQPGSAQPAFRELYTADGQKVLVLAPSSSQQTNGLAITSLVLALTGGLILAGLPAIITGHIARRQIREWGQSGNGLAVPDHVMGYLTLATILLVVIMVASS